MTWWKFWDLGITKPSSSGVTVKIEKVEREEPWPPPPPDPKPKVSPVEDQVANRTLALQERLQWFFDAIDYEHDAEGAYDELNFVYARVVAHSVIDAANAIIETADHLDVWRLGPLSPDASTLIMNRIKSLLHLGLREQAVREVGDYFLLRGVPADVITEALAEYRECDFEGYDDVKTCP